PFGEMVADALLNMHMPSYYALVRLFADAGSDAAGLRLPSAVLSSLAAGVLAVIGRRVGGSVWTGLAAGLLFALSPFQVLYGQEARAYGLLLFGAVLGLAGLTRLAASSAPGSERCAWGLWAAGTLIALYAMTLGLPWLAVSAAVVLALIFTRPKPERRGLWVRSGAAFGVVLVLWLPWLAFLTETAGRINWIPPATVQSTVEALDAVFLFGLVDPVGFAPVALGAPGLGYSVLLAAAIGAWRLRRNKIALFALLAATLVLPLVLTAASLARPTFIPRYLIWSAPPFFVLAAAALGGLPRTGQALAVAALAGLGLFNLEPYYRAELKPDWPGALRAAWAEAEAGDALYLETDMEHFCAKVFETAAGREDASPKRIGSPDAVAAWLDGGGAVWVIDGFPAFRAPNEGPNLAVRIGLADRVTLTHAFGRDVTLIRLAPPTGRKD
ncbi:MAG: hypothetical protein HQL36_12675, partial [Alphaproteobacteria bacterium]|nr:hypothetical protein [Alphaproteobacteria bacterium]